MSNELAVQPTLLKSTSAVIEFNFDELNKAVDKYLDDHKNTVVTVDTVKATKKLMADINAKKDGIRQAFKDAKKAVIAPVGEADNKVKTVEAKFAEVYALLKTQTDKFEDERKAEILEKMQVKLAELWESEGVYEEFRNASIKSVTLSDATESGKVSSSGFRKLEALVATDKALQMQTESRLAKLENECYKAGLKVPFGRGHVEAFLFASEEEYTGRLESLIANEVSRQEQIEQAALAEAEKVKETQQEPEPVEQEAITPQPTELPNEPEPFHVEPQRDERNHRKQLNNDALRKLMKRLKDAGLDDEKQLFIAKDVITAAAMGELGALKMVY